MKQDRDGKQNVPSVPTHNNAAYKIASGIVIIIFSILPIPPVLLILRQPPIMVGIMHRQPITVQMHITFFDYYRTSPHYDRDAQEYFICWDQFYFHYGIFISSNLLSSF